MTEGTGRDFEQNIAYEKSLGLKSYNLRELAYYYSPSVRIYGAVIDMLLRSPWSITRSTNYSI